MRPDVTELASLDKRPQLSADNRSGYRYASSAAP